MVNVLAGNQTAPPSIPFSEIYKFINEYFYRAKYFEFE